MLYVSILVMLEVKWKASEKEVGRLNAQSFNPCYVGSKMESKLNNYSPHLSSLFQSLLCWK